MSELFCTNCGSKLEPGSIFCEECGTPVEDAQASNAAQQPRKWPIFVVIAVVVVAVIIAVVVFTQGESPSGESKSNAPAQEQVESSSTTVAPSEESSRTATPSTIAAPPVFTQIETSSDLTPDNTTSDYGGRNTTDGLLETAWNEGAPGDGTGEWIEFIAPSPQCVSSVSIAGGYPKLYKDGSDVYYKNNRPRQITISYEGGSQTFMMQDLRGQLQTFTFAQPIETTFICITINSVYKGSNYDDCCIAEVEIS